MCFLTNDRRCIVRLCVAEHARDSTGIRVPTRGTLRVISEYIRASRRERRAPHNEKTQAFHAFTTSATLGTAINCLDSPLLLLLPSVRSGIAPSQAESKTRGTAVQHASAIAKRRMGLPLPSGPTTFPHPPLQQGRPVISLAFPFAILSSATPLRSSCATDDLQLSSKY